MQIFSFKGIFIPYKFCSRYTHYIAKYIAVIFIESAFQSSHTIKVKSYTDTLTTPYALL